MGKEGGRKKVAYLLFIIMLGGVILAGLWIKRYVWGRGKVYVQRMPGGQFQLMVEGKPFFIRGVVYHPIPIGQNHQYNFWAAPEKPWIEDGRLMQEMGVNTVRFFQPGPEIEETRKVIDQLYRRYGIRTILGHWMDYWRPGNYAEEKYRQDLTWRVLEMVKAYKDEEGLLLWILGNENNLSWHSRARNPWSCAQVERISDPYQQALAKARYYYSLVNEIAREIKKIDPQHPVALGNADTYTLEVAKEVCPDIDMVALTTYRGKTLGNLWREVRRKIDKPVLIMEFGCDSFNAKIGQEDQEMQSAFIMSQWADIQNNAFGASGEGNSLGGCIFEWTDEWWKHNETMPAGWYVHNTKGDWSSGAYYFDIGTANNMNMNEEWWGIVALSPELEKGLNKRLPRKVYYELQKLWKEE